MPICNLDKKAKMSIPQSELLDIKNLEVKKTVMILYQIDGTMKYNLNPSLFVEYLTRRTEAQWGELMDRVYALEDQQKNASSNERIYKHQIPIEVWLVFGRENV